MRVSGQVVQLTSLMVQQSTVIIDSFLMARRSCSRRLVWWLTCLSSVRPRVSCRILMWACSSLFVCVVWLSTLVRCCLVDWTACTVGLNWCATNLVTARWFRNCILCRVLTWLEMTVLQVVAVLKWNRRRAVVVLSLVEMVSRLVSIRLGRWVRLGVTSVVSCGLSVPSCVASVCMCGRFSTDTV